MTLNRNRLLRLRLVLADVKVYQVGGAVRDKLLGLPVKDHDWVVVGATPQQLLDQGYKQVGKDFPVFLHPHTKEEYALARTERKTGPGYTGFSFHAAPDVTLEDDLIRRDLTINALAMGPDGEIIDPFGGQQDLAAKKLRHVSDAFAEDPVRILRVARFYSRYAAQGFTIADETIELMRNMVANGEVDALVAERVWTETQRALEEKQPSHFFLALRACGALARLYPEIDALFGVPQPEKHHPEIDAGVHTMMVLTQAARLSSDAKVRFAALLHDLGKGTTPPAQWPRHIGHEKRSADLAKQLCERIKAPKEYRELAQLCAQYHTHSHRALALKSSTIADTLQAIDAFRRPQRFEDFLLCCMADSRGRTGFEDIAYPQADFLRQCQQAAIAIDARALAQAGFKGARLGQELRRQRISAIANIPRPT